MDRVVGGNQVLSETPAHYQDWGYQTNETYINSTSFHVNSMPDCGGSIQAVLNRRRARFDQLAAVARP
jgi:hypothetical protein